MIDPSAKRKIGKRATPPTPTMVSACRGNGAVDNQRVPLGATGRCPAEDEDRQPLRRRHREGIAPFVFVAATHDQRRDGRLIINRAQCDRA